MEDLYFLRCQDLDDPVHLIDPKTVGKNVPFYRDYFAVIYLKQVWWPSPGYKPLLINDKKLLELYYANDLYLNINTVITTCKEVHNKTLKINYRVLTLIDGMYCLYTEKRYIWDGFKSVGVCLIISPDNDYLYDYFHTNIVQQKYVGGKNGLKV